MKLRTNFIIMMICFIFIPIISSADESRKILLINSNASVEKYKLVQEEFRKAISKPISELNLEGVNEESSFSSYDAGLVYCIGTKAYSHAARYFQDKMIVFSSIINYLRLPMTPKTYGISNELHPRMPLYTFRSIFPTIRRIGVLYSKQYTLQWVESSKAQAKELGIEIIDKAISSPGESESALKSLLGQIEALWLISDPMVMSEEKYLLAILKMCDERKKPIFSYNESFAELGAILTVSADDATIGRQAAGMAAELLSGGAIDDKVQFPAGSRITLNLKKAGQYNMEYNSGALGIVNTIIR